MNSFTSSDKWYWGLKYPTYLTLALSTIIITTNSQSNENNTNSPNLLSAILKTTEMHRDALINESSEHIDNNPIEKNTGPSKTLSKEETRLKSEMEGKVRGFNTVMLLFIDIANLQTKYINDMNDITKFYNEVYTCMKHENGEKINNYDNAESKRRGQKDNAKQELGRIGDLF